MNKKIHILYLLTLCTAMSFPLEAVDWRTWLANMYHRNYGSRSTAFKILAPATLIGLCAAAYYKHTINQQIIEKQNAQKRNMLADLNEYQNSQLQQLFNQNSPDFNSALTTIEILLQRPLDLVVPEETLNQYNNNLPQIFSDYHLTTGVNATNSSVYLEERWRNQWEADTWNYALHRIKERNRYAYIEESMHRNIPFLSIDSTPPLLAQSKEMIKACLPADNEVTNKAKEYNLSTRHGGVDQIMTYIILKKFILENNLSNISIPFHFLTLTEYKRKIDSHQEATNIINQHINIMVTPPYKGLRCLSPNFIDDISKEGFTQNYTASVFTQNIEKQPSNQPNNQTIEQLATLAALFKVTNENTVYDKDGNAIIIDTNKKYLQSLKSKLKQLSEQQKQSLEQALQEAAARQDAQIAEANRLADETIVQNKQLLQELKEQEKQEQQLQAESSSSSPQLSPRSYPKAQAKGNQLAEIESKIKDFIEDLDVEKSNLKQLKQELETVEQRLKAENPQSPSPTLSPQIQSEQKLKEQEKEEDVNITARIIGLIPTLEEIAQKPVHINVITNMKDQIKAILYNSDSNSLPLALRQTMISFDKLKTTNNDLRKKHAEYVLRELRAYQSLITPKPQINRDALKQEIDDVLAVTLHTLDQAKKSKETDQALTQVITFLQKNSESASNVNLYKDLLASLENKKKSSTPIQDAQDIVNKLHQIYNIPE